jgi:hypothetical protein
VLAVVWFVWRFVARMLAAPSQPTEPGDLADVPARLRPRPGKNAGAVALAEPDEDEDEVR